MFFSDPTGMFPASGYRYSPLIQQVLIPLNEPIFGTSKKSQIQTFLEQNDGAGIQHVVRKGALYRQ